MLKSIAEHPGLKYRYVYGIYNGSPEVYALVISDPLLAKAFLEQFPESENYDSDKRAIKKGTLLGDVFYTVIEHYYEGRSDDNSGENYDSRAIGFAYILEKYNAGISIAKTDGNGNLKKITGNIQQITVPNSGGKVKEGVQVSKCP